jgi:hypothetical protein
MLGKMQRNGENFCCLFERLHPISRLPVTDKELWVPWTPGWNISKILRRGVHEGSQWEIRETFKEQHPNLSSFSRKKCHHNYLRHCVADGGLGATPPVAHLELELFVCDMITENNSRGLFNQHHAILGVWQRTSQEAPSGQYAVEPVRRAFHMVVGRRRMQFLIDWRCDTLYVLSSSSLVSFRVDDKYSNGSCTLHVCIRNLITDVLRCSKLYLNAMHASLFAACLDPSKKAVEPGFAARMDRLFTNLDFKPGCDFETGFPPTAIIKRWNYLAIERKRRIERVRLTYVEKLRLLALHRAHLRFAPDGEGARDAARNFAALVGDDKRARCA